LFIAIVTVVLATEKSELNRKSMCDSVDGFITAMKTFQPSASKGDLSLLFTISDRDEDEHPKPVSALAIESCDTIWSDDNSALLFATANPPTIATHSSIGVLFLLVRQRGHWGDCRSSTLCRNWQGGGGLRRTNGFCRQRASA